MLWPFFTKENPCPACGRSGDWSCRAGDKVFVCMRTPSDRPCNTRDGGWFHSYATGAIKPPISQARALPVANKRPFNANEEYKRAFDSLQPAGKVESLAQELGVTFNSLCLLGCIWSVKYGAFIFPMYDGENNVIGICRRYETGDKKFLGSLGIFIPDFYFFSDNEIDIKMVFICEGASDCAALLSIGLFAIARPSCTAGNQFVVEFLKRLKIRRAVIIADNDEIKVAGTRPGIEGAKKLQKEIGVSSILWIPPSPIKDVRQFVRQGGTRQMILNDVNGKAWTRK